MPEVEVVDPVQEVAVARRTRRFAESEQRARYREKIRRGGTLSWPDAGDGVALQPADRRVLAALPRYGLLSFRQLQYWFYGGNMQLTSKRMRALRECGLVHMSPHEGWVGKVFWATSQTVALQSDALIPVSAPASPVGERVLHRLAVNEVLLTYESKGRRVLTEREIRAVEQGSRIDASRVAATLGTSVTPIREGGREFWFRSAVSLPDGVVVTDDGLRAVEVEMTVKDRSRMFRILRGYRDESPFEQTYYFCTPDVKLAFEGWWSGEGVWQDGWLQELSMVRPVGVEWSETNYRECPIRVFALNPVDEGVAWQLDMRAAPPMRWIRRREWKRLRTIWETHPSAGEGRDKMPFLRWWLTVWPELESRQRAEASRLYRAGSGQQAASKR